MKTLTIFVVLLKLVTSFKWTGSNKVMVDEGEIVGGEYTQSNDFDIMRAYLGVPYAEPPVGKHRLKLPVPKQPWRGSLDARSFPASCMQDNNTGSVLDFYANSPLWNGTGQTSEVSEDCLKLNIFRPDPLGPASLPHPVMVWIYGGAFVSGSGNPSGFRLAELGNVIVVTVNYRLGVFGFMSTGDEALPGNLGLWDQHVALKWIKKNIHHFDGDPNKITLFGESAGSISVDFHLFHSQNSNPKLFHRAIMQSGHIIDHIMLEKNSTQLAVSLAEKLKCSDRTSSAKMVDCFRQADAQTLLNTANQVVSGLQGFSPVIDGKFITDKGENLMKNSKLDVDILTGVNAYEGWLYPLAIGGFARNGINKTEFLDIAMSPGVLDINDWTDHFKQALLEQYAPHLSPNSSEAWYLALIDAAGDRIFNAPTAKFLSETVSRNNGSTFMYLFNEPNQYGRPDKPTYVGATHADEILYMFADLAYYAKATPKEKTASREIASMWIGFARSGNFTAKTGEAVEPWTVEDQDYLEITSNMGPHSFKQHLWPDRMAFWNEELPKLEEQSSITVAQGQLFGKIRDQNGKYQSEEFLGVPFAAPPTGNNRFREAQEPESWTGVLKVQSYKHACIQLPYDMNLIPVEGLAEFIGDGRKQSEDCLYLNVFVPKSVRDARTKKLSVMVWIYGGGFVTGKTADYHLSAFAAMNDVIAVTVSYRLGPFGFFRLGKEATGNYGLSDQQMALKWVNKNIGEFGGNPQDVTVFGESAGGASVMFQVSNEESRQYFQKAILMSGTIESPWALEREGNTEKYSKALVTKLGCNSSADVMSCVRGYTDASKIQKLDLEGVGTNLDIRYKPVVDESFVKSSELYTVDEKSFSDITMLLGVNSLEMAVSAEDFLKAHTVSTDGVSVNMTRFWDVFDNNLDTWIAPSFRTPLAREFIKHEYFAGTTNNLEDVTKSLAILLSDSSFAAGALRTALKHSEEGGKGFFYVFGLDRTDSVEGFPKANLSGAAHADDLLVAFGSPFLDLQNHTDAGRTASKNFMAMITKFAKTGNPSFSGVYFPVFDNKAKEYVELKVTGVVKKNPWPRRMAFWNDLLPSLPTVAPSTTTVESLASSSAASQSSGASATTTAENTAVEADALGSLGIPAKSVEIALWVMIGVSCLAMLVIIKLSCDVCRHRKAEDINP